MAEQFTYKEIAGMIDHALLHPTLPENQLIAGCAMATLYKTATVCVKPCDVKRSVSLLNGSQTKVCTVIGFPHGVNLTEIKVMETQQACEQGANEVDMVINPGRVIDGNWKYLDKEIRAVSQAAHENGAKIKVIFENDYLQKGGAGLDQNSLIRKLCQISGDAGADWVKTSTGFGYTLQTDGTLASLGASVKDVCLMVDACGQGTQVKAAGGVKNLSTLLRMRKIGATRIGTSSTQVILDQCRKELGLPPLSLATESNPSGY